MYSTCTFCHASLGKNEALEHFPVGSRLAFDQARGRLWAVCPNCRQWNLSPLEQRWEAIEEGERLFRDARLRVSTDHVGLARLRDGTELIRIGEAQRPEFAAWRYGDRFTRRFRKQVALVGVGTAAFVGTVVAGPAVGLTFGGLATLPWNLASMLKAAYDARLVAARFTDEQGTLYVNVLQADLAQVVSLDDDPRGWGIQVAAKRGAHPSGRFAGGPPIFGDHRVVLRGANAEEAARSFLPRINRGGGRRHTVAEAVKLLEDMADRDAMFRNIARPIKGERSWALAPIGKQPSHLRLALEMAVHEEAERRALEGELALLEAQWKDAEDIAAIADNLTLPERIVERLARLRGGG